MAYLQMQMKMYLFGWYEHFKLLLRTCEMQTTLYYLEIACIRKMVVLMCYVRNKHLEFFGL